MPFGASNSSGASFGPAFKTSLSCLVSGVGAPLPLLQGLLKTAGSRNLCFGLSAPAGILLALCGTNCTFGSWSGSSSSFTAGVSLIFLLSSSLCPLACQHCVWPAGLSLGRCRPSFECRQLHPLAIHCRPLMSHPRPLVIRTRQCQNALQSSCSSRSLLASMSKTNDKSPPVCSCSCLRGGV